MRTLCIILLLFCLVACNNSGDTKAVTIKDSLSTDSISTPPVKKDSSLSYVHTFADTALETRITQALMKLPFVKKTNVYIDSFSNHQHGIAFMLDSLGKDEQEISVQAGYNGEQRFETYYRFYVNPKTMEIKVYDAVNDKKIPLKLYLKSQHQQ